MTQSNSDFILNFSKFKKKTLLSYFDISKPKFIFSDAHQSGLSAILAQDSDKDNAKPVSSLHIKMYK